MAPHHVSTPALPRGARHIRAAAPRDVFSTFDKVGGRIGSGLLGSGQGGIGRCRR